MLRGALIVIEGCDRSGKSTLCKKIVSALTNDGIKAEYLNFPDRDTSVGQWINKYLSSQVDFSDHAIHLLFSANRWEKEKYIKEKLKSGVTLVVDRYAYSGVAFSSAKGLGVEWCKGSDVGLPKPDKVFLLTLSFEALQARQGFGEERYEKVDFQEKVMSCYKALKDGTWEEIDADRSPEQLHELVLAKVHKVRENVTEDIGKLWLEK